MYLVCEMYGGINYKKIGKKKQALAPPLYSSWGDGLLRLENDSAAAVSQNAIFKNMQIHNNIY